MNIREKNRSEMFERVVAFGEAEKTRLNAIPKVATAISELKMIQREISLNDRLLFEGTKAKVFSKDVTQKEIIPLALVIAGGIFSYAVDISDEELIKSADINSKTIHKLRDSEIPVFIERIIDKADELGDLLMPYGLTAEKRTAARGKLDEYIAKFTTLNTGKGTKSAARKTISDLFDNGDKKLRVLDKLMIGFKESDTELFNLYASARVIIDKSSSRNTNPEPVPPTNP